MTRPRRAKKASAARCSRVFRPSGGVKPAMERVKPSPPSASSTLSQRDTVCMMLQSAW